MTKFQFFTFYLLILLSNSILLKSQISKLEVPKNEINTETLIKPFDSLTSLDSKNYLSQIGQTLYLLDSKYAAENERGYSNFHTQPTFLADTNRDNYKYTYKSKDPIGSLFRKSDYNLLKNKYFYVIDIINGPADKSNPNLKITNFKLIETTSKDTIYYRADIDTWKGWKDTKFINVGYFEKLKKKYKGEVYIVQKSSSFNNVEEKGWLNFEKGASLECVDLLINDNDYDKVESTLPIVAILQDKESNKKIYVPLSHLNETSSGTSFSYSVGGYLFVKHNYNPSLKSLKVLEIEANEKKTLIKKFGIANSNIILSGELKIGFSKDMCLEAWGKPKSINTTTAKQGTQEQWVYGSNSRYIYFTNGKLTAFQD